MANYEKDEFNRSSAQEEYRSKESSLVRDNKPAGSELPPSGKEHNDLRTTEEQLGKKPTKFDKITKASNTASNIITKTVTVAATTVAVVGGVMVLNDTRTAPNYVSFEYVQSEFNTIYFELLSYNDESDLEREDNPEGTSSDDVYLNVVLLKDNRQVASRNVTNLGWYYDNFENLEYSTLYTLAVYVDLFLTIGEQDPIVTYEIETGEREEPPSPPDSSEDSSDDSSDSSEPKTEFYGIYWSMSRMDESGAFSSSPYYTATLSYNDVENLYDNGLILAVKTPASYQDGEDGNTYIYGFPATDGEVTLDDIASELPLDEELDIDILIDSRTESDNPTSGRDAILYGEEMEGMEVVYSDKFTLSPRVLYYDTSSSVGQTPAATVYFEDPFGFWTNFEVDVTPTATATVAEQEHFSVTTDDIIDNADEPTHFVLSSATGQSFENLDELTIYATSTYSLDLDEGESSASVLVYQL